MTIFTPRRSAACLYWPGGRALDPQTVAAGRSGGRRGRAVPVPTAPPSSVVNAAKAYFSADYRKALSILGELQFEDIRATVQANLFKAAAAFTLYRLEGQDGDRESAVAAVKQLRAVRPQFSPDPQVFSPSFIQFFERNG